MSAWDRLRGTWYHVINWGNCGREAFGTAGAAGAFASVLAEASRRYGWRVHAYVVMANHHHLALETPEPNLVDGMHWLQSTYATRRHPPRQGLVIEPAVVLPVKPPPIHSATTVPTGMQVSTWGFPEGHNSLTPLLTIGYVDAQVRK